MDKLLTRPKIVLYAFAINIFVFVLFPFLLSNDKSHFLNILPELPELFVDYFWTILLAVDTKTVAYSPLADIIFKLPSLFPKTVNLAIFFTVFAGAVFLYMKFLLDKEYLNKKQLYLYIPFVLLSYGFLFELIWGQWNLISFVLIIYAVYVVYKKNRFLSYLLFAVTASLKVYPIIFILLYARNFKDYRKWVVDIVCTTIIFIALFFVQGFDDLIKYVDQLSYYSSNPVVWYANMSIYSFNSNLNEIYGCNLGIFPYFFALFCLLIIFIVHIQQNKQLNGILLLALIIIALLFPSVSMDYKLCLIILCYPIIYNSEFTSNNYIDKSFLFISSVLIFSTLFSFKFYEIVLRNWFYASKFIVLILLLIAFTIYSVFNYLKFNNFEHK
jgi:hypothetical protein